MNIACPECSTVYRIDPTRVPHGGIATKCRECGAAFRVETGDDAPAAVRTAAPAPAKTAPPAPPAPP
ncbi:MAG TPA: zinc-ribbon domain-containing protein, partial [Longimicrobiales bacterium]|nr:zinc-ribbon domain-containing protein [Longimicrobiales bacterium]